MRSDSYYDTAGNEGLSATMLHLVPRQRVPCNMTLDRAWRWCILGSIRELRLAAGREREIAWPNMRRLFARRWADTCTLYDLGQDSIEREELRQVGVSVLGEAYARAVQRLRHAA